MINKLENNGNHFVQALRFFKKHPHMYFRSLIPVIISAIIIGVFIVAAAIGIFFLTDLIVSPFEHLEKWSIVIKIGSTLMFVSIMFFLSYILFTDLTLQIGDSYYEKLWKEVEKDSLGSDKAEELSFNATAIEKIAEESKTIFMSLKTALRIGFFVFLISLIPIIGNIIGIIFGFMATGLLTTEDHTRRAMQGRNYRLEERIKIMKSKRNDAYIFGMISQGLSIIPFVQLFIMPITIVASTYLVHDILGETPSISSRELTE